MLQASTPLEPAEIEARARKHASTMGKQVDGLKALHLPLEAIHGHAAFKVNPKGDGVLPLARPSRLEIPGPACIGGRHRIRTCPSA
jgi:hypothetical protein